MTRKANFKQKILQIIVKMVYNLMKTRIKDRALFKFKLWSNSPKQWAKVSAARLEVFYFSANFLLFYNKRPKIKKAEENWPKGENGDCLRGRK